MMNRGPAFNSPFLIGFERLERAVSHLSKASAEGYPPHNIEQTGENAVRITLAVAGFDVDDLEVSVADNQLVVKGKKRNDDANRVFLHRGIAARQFQRSWVLAEGWEVDAAGLDQGLLHIDLRRRVPDREVRTIAIAKGTSAEGRARREARTIDIGAEG
jgi:HSP20 family molecular chaperone IbpA